MNRRGFLRIMAAAGATLAVPPFVLAAPGIIVPDKPLALGSVRELAQYRIESDSYVVRIDAFNKRTREQRHVNFEVACANRLTMRKHYLVGRKEADEHLRAHLLHHGWDARDMIALPIPDGIILPPWIDTA
jgi:hypothetical protein